MVRIQEEMPAIELRDGCLIELDVFLKSIDADGIEEIKGTKAINITNVFCHLKEDLDMQLGAKVVDLRGLDLSSAVT